jgi:hypothetical protein
VPIATKKKRNLSFSAIRIPTGFARDAKSALS